MLLEKWVFINHLKVRAVRSRTRTWQHASDNLAACSCASKSRLYIRPWKRGKLSCYRVNIWVKYIHALRHSHTYTYTQMHWHAETNTVMWLCAGQHNRCCEGSSKCRWFVSCEDLLQWFPAVLRVKGQYALPLVNVRFGSLEVREVMFTRRNAISQNICPFLHFGSLFLSVASIMKLNSGHHKEIIVQSIFTHIWEINV